MSVYYDDTVRPTSSRPGRALTPLAFPRRLLSPELNHLVQLRLGGRPRGWVWEWDVPSEHLARRRRLRRHHLLRQVLETVSEIRGGGADAMRASQGAKYQCWDRAGTTMDDCTATLWIWYTPPLPPRHEPPLTADALLLPSYPTQPPAPTFQSSSTRLPLLSKSPRPSGCGTIPALPQPPSPTTSPYVQRREFQILPIPSELGTLPRITNT